ncbi:MAG: Rha family transcriptional regulator [Pseudomonadota bacterium]
MSNLVSLNETGSPVTTSLAIADGVGYEHKSVIQLVRQYVEDLREFGNIAFEMRNSTSGAGRPTEYALLNEQQATLLLTYFRNTDIVREFKKRLVKAFFELAEKVRTQVPQVPQSRMELLQMAMDAEQERLVLETQNKQLESKIEEDSSSVAREQEFNQLLKEADDEANKIPDTPITSADLIRLCKRDKSCRDNR